MSNHLSSGMNNASVPSRNSPAELSTPQHAPFTTTPDAFLSHPMTIRSFILHDVLLEKPIKKSFFELSEIFGNEKMSYSDFKYWYNKFSCGSFGMEDERRPQFSTLPIHIIERIVEKLELKEIMILRNVCKSLRNFVDQQDELPCYSIEIVCDEDYVRCRFNKEDVIYASTSWKMPTDIDNWKYGHARIIKSVDYQRIACDQLKYVLMKPKLCLSQLCIGYECENTPFSTLKCFESLFNSIGRRIMAQMVKIEVCGPAITISMLSMLDPRTLKSIELKSFEHPDAAGYENWSKEKINQLTSLVQWKHASKLIAKEPFDFCEPSHFTHFKEIDIIIDFINRESLIKLKSMFSHPRSSLNRCLVKAEFELNRSVFSNGNGLILQHDVTLAGALTYYCALPGIYNFYLAFHYYPDKDAITIRKLRR